MANRVVDGVYGDQVDEGEEELQEEHGFKRGHDGGARGRARPLD